jgi:hypothetical protein
MMDQTVQTPLQSYKVTGHQQAWNMIAGQLRLEMSKALFETWIQPLSPVSYDGGRFVLGAYNAYARDWVENRLKGRISRLLEGIYSQPVSLEVVVANEGNSDSPVLNKKAQTVQASKESSPDEDGFDIQQEAPQSEKKSKQPGPPASNRKIMLQRAYGSERAGIIQPERGMFVTLYFFYQWLPLIGQSAMTVIMAARSMCYWNPLTGEMRNVIETDMSELAKRASVSVRTVKSILNDELVQQYFLRYKVRRMMTPNGVRTAGIFLQVRMDDPLTPEDQASSGILEDEDWYLPEFDD